MKKVTLNKTAGKVKKFLWTAYASLVCMTMGAINAFAVDNTSAKKAWNEIFNSIKPFLLALGGVMIAVGGINMALGFKSEDAEGIQRGVKTLVAGVAVVAVIGVAWKFVTI